MPESDYLIKAITKNNAFRAIAASTSNLNEEARQRHNLSHTSTVALGRAFACGILLCNTLRKTKGHLTLKIKGGGPLGDLIVDASNEGTVRGYVNNPQIECFDNKGYVDIDQAIGKKGSVNVSYDNEKGLPYIGSVEIVSGEIAKDVVNYLAKSEQTRSFLSCGVYLEPTSGKVLHSGGILIQAMPEAKDEDINTLEETVSRLDPFSLLLRSGLSLEEIVKKTLKNFDVEIVSEFEGLCFYCGCTQDKFESALKSIGKKEIQKIIETIGYAEGRCHFCSNIYMLKKEQLEKLLNEKDIKD
jgi:molecular chaperone Hsp33